MSVEAVARIRFDEPQATPSVVLALSPLAWKEAFPGLRVRDLDDRAPVYRRGEAVDAVFVIESGYVRLAGQGQRGREITSGIRSARQAFGPGLNGALRADESAFAKGPARVYRVPGADFRRALALGAPFATRSLRIFRARQQLFAQRMDRLARLPAPERVLATLAELLVHHGAPCDHGETIHLRLGTCELADLAGAIPPQVRMTLSALRRRELVRCTHDYICVSELPVLLRLLRRRPASPAVHPVD